MTCAIGSGHTITLSDDGFVYSFGQNDIGQLGLGHNNIVPFPCRIPNLPQIKQVSCGWNFTVCVDFEGFIWTFGGSIESQQGFAKNLNSNLKSPQQILNIPPVLSVSCGAHHTLIISNDSDLWSCGDNKFGQLCLGKGQKGIDRPTFKQTPFSNISKISSGNRHSLFQNNKGEIFSCGFNALGDCGLGHFESPQFTPILIPNLPSNIIHFVCGGYHNLFLDSEGNVFSVGFNQFGQLGLGHNENKNVLLYCIKSNTKYTSHSIHFLYL